MLVVQKYEFFAFPGLQSQSYLVEEECLWRKGDVQKPFDSQVFRASGILTGEFYTATGLVKVSVQFIWFLDTELQIALPYCLVK